MNEKRVILVIEDERTISNFICRALNANDYKSIPAFSGKEGLSLFFSHSPDLVLLDLGLPDLDGMEILQQVTGLPQETPVIIISARDRESEKVKALDMGADDYIVKPFGVSEMLARVRTTLRRSDRLKLSQGSQKDVYHIKDLTVDIAKHQVLLNGEEIHFTQNEFKILELLCIHAGKVLTARVGPLRQQQQPDPPGEHGQHPPQAQGEPLRAQVRPHRAGHRLPDAGGLRERRPPDPDTAKPPLRPSHRMAGRWFFLVCVSTARRAPSGGGDGRGGLAGSGPVPGGAGPDGRLLHPSGGRAGRLRPGRRHYRPMKARSSSMRSMPC